MKIKTLVIDDEPLARDRLLKLLRAEPEVEVIGDAGDGRAAVALIRKTKPDLIFLDVQMPELDGFGVLAELDADERPAVIFVTAYDKFALQAFEVHAVDYLLKPFDKERFQTALRRALNRFAHQQPAQIHDQLSALLHELRPSQQNDRLAVKSDGRVVFLKITDLDWVEAAERPAVTR